MLLRDLKRIIHEAEEPNAAATETSQTPATEKTAQTPATEKTAQTPTIEKTAQTPATEKTLNKLQKTVDASKQASDGIGKESYKMSKELETKLSVSLKDLLNKIGR